MSLQPKLFILPSLAPTNHQTSLLLLNYFCRVPSGLSSSLLWLASEAIVTFPQPSPGAIFKTTNIFTFSCLVPEVWRVQWIWILRVRFVVLFISWGISANSFLLCQNLRRDGCSAQLDYCDSSQHVKRFPCGKPQQREFSLLSFCFYRQRRKSVSSEPTFILSSQTYQANQWQLYNFIILIITSTTVQ